MLFAISQSTSAQNNTNCADAIKSAQDAANRADWIIEGDVNNTLRFTSSPGRVSVSIENAKVIFESEKSPRFLTAILETDSCFPNAMNTLLEKPEKIIGKRMRFFGNRLRSGRGRHFFYMQPAGQAMPPLPVPFKKFIDRKHPSEAEATLPDGWSRARSTEGHFLIDMPGPFEDLTKGSSEQPAFMLRGTDRYGVTFMAVFERSGPGSVMGETFDSTISQPNAKTFTFKGADAVSTLGELPGSNGERITHGLWFRIPGGTFMLGIVTDKEHEKESLKVKERFYNSLTF